VAAAVVWPILAAISDMVKCFCWARKPRRKYWGKETLPRASSLERFMRKQRWRTVKISASFSQSLRIWLSLRGVDMVS